MLNYGFLGNRNPPQTNEMKTETKTKKRQPFTHEVRTKVPKRIGAELEKEAAREGLKPTDIVRRALMERYRSESPEQP